MPDERIITSDLAQVAALKTIYDHCRPGRRPDWDFSQPGQVSLPDDETARIKDDRLTSLRVASLYNFNVADNMRSSRDGKLIRIRDENRF